MITQRNGWLWCAAAAVLFGAATPATKLLVGDIHPVALAGLLYLGAAIAVAPFVTRDMPARPTVGQRRRLMLAVILGGGIAPVLLVAALDRTRAATVSVLLNLELVATAVIARLFLREHVGRRAAAGISLVAAGGIVLAGAKNEGLAVGAMLVIGACVCWGIDNAITASLDGYKPARIALTKGAVAGSVNVILGIAIGGFPPVRLIVPALLIGAFGYGLSITCWITGARLVGASRGQVIFALAPFVGALLAWPVNDESPTKTLVVAGAISLLGVLVVASADHGHDHTHDRIEHAHAINVSDPHHGDATIDVVAGHVHRHLDLTHRHEHLPDIHHRHEHGTALGGSQRRSLRARVVDRLQAEFHGTVGRWLRRD